MLQLIKPVLVLSLTLVGLVACSDENKQPEAVVTEQPVIQSNDTMQSTEPSQLAPVPTQAPVTDATTMDAPATAAPVTEVPATNAQNVQ